MNCPLQGCPGQYEAREIAHTVRHRSDLDVIDHVPAEVCPICGDTLLSPETVRHIETRGASRGLDLCLDLPPGGDQGCRRHETVGEVVHHDPKAF
jgi:YgiT-type zinc finger domain-containing protein